MTITPEEVFNKVFAALKDGRPNSAGEVSLPSAIG
jgi:hypothetical protein